MPCTESCRSTERERMHQNAGFHMPQVPGMGRKPWASRLAHSGRGERKDHAAHRAVCRVCVCVKSRVRSALCSRSFCGDWCRCVATCFCVTVSRDKTSYTTTHHAISVARAPRSRGDHIPVSDPRGAAAGFPPRGLVLCGAGTRSDRCAYKLFSYKQSQRHTAHSLATRLTFCPPACPCHPPPCRPPSRSPCRRPSPWPSPCRPRRPSPA